MSVFGYDRGAAVSLAQAKSLAAYEGGKFNSFFIRYLADANSWKYFGWGEVENLLAAGYMIGSVFQEGKDGPKGGYNAGRAAATKALARTSVVGQPKYSAIFFAVDYDAPASDYDAFEAFLKGAQEVLGEDFYAGIYGKYAVIEEMGKRGACKYFWQTYAWSGGKFSKYADLYQYKNDIQVNGINVDLNECFNTDILWGQYTPPVEQPVVEEPIVIESPKVETLSMYDDVPVTHWAASAIEKAYNKGFMTGVADRKFGLTQEVTREQLAVALDQAGMLKNVKRIKFNRFSDVPAGHWAENAIHSAFEAGAMDGIADNVFGLGKTLTREQFTKTLENLGLITIDDFWKIPDIYQDVPSDHWAMESIKDAYLKGVIVGVAEHKFGLGEAVMREQLAKVFDNMQKLD